MADTVGDRLKSLGIAIPNASSPVANYVPWVRSGNLVFVSGQLPLQDGTVACVGQIATEVNADQGYAAARLCALNLIAHVRNACDGDLNRVKRVVKLTGFVASGPAFTDHPAVINGASDLMVQVFGDAGRHSRAAVGASSLPRGATVEVEAIFEVI
ncbi:MAG: RidA family protein [Rhodospirillaceae bacterium]|nr:MAG: RidA family protein [Rhodospirillaceae bacterium]